MSGSSLLRQRWWRSSRNKHPRTLASLGLFGVVFACSEAPVPRTPSGSAPAASSLEGHEHQEQDQTPTASTPHAGFADAGTTVSGPAVSGPAVSGPSGSASASQARSAQEGTTDEGPGNPPLRPVECIRLTTMPKSAQEKFSVDGYRVRVLRLFRSARQTQCVVVTWPAGRESNAGKRSRVAEHIDDGWFRAIENTLRRIPFHQARLVERIVIDNHPTQHGIAAFDREDPLDGRDGHTIWLTEHLFRDPNHWERGVRGDYFAYHTSVDGQVFDDQPGDHDLFSPVLLHEIGHLVMYHVINPASDKLSPPTCALTCSDDGSCVNISERERELPCISPYCRPFKFTASTENWAEQYRFFYQSSVTRQLLAQAATQTTNCLSVLIEHDGDDGVPRLEPWNDGLPDIPKFHPSRWNSCGGKACKAW